MLGCLIIFHIQHNFLFYEFPIHDKQTFRKTLNMYLISKTSTCTSFVDYDRCFSCKDISNTSNIYIYALVTGENMINDDAIRAFHGPPAKYVIAEVMVTDSIASVRHKQREITEQTSRSLQTSLLHPPAAVHHFDWQLRGGLWRADESKKPISASEATAAVLCSPAHLPPPPPALLPASHRLLQALLPPLPAANRKWTSSHGGSVLFTCSLYLSGWLLLKHQGKTRKCNIHKLVAKATAAFKSVTLTSVELWETSQNIPARRDFVPLLRLLFHAHFASHIYL